MERAATPSRAEASRRRILELIEREPGLSMSEVARRCGVYWTSAALQVERLRREGLVVTLRVGRRRVLFPRSTIEEARSDAHGILAEPACRRVALAILEHPRSRVWELCAITGMSERAVYHHVRRLVESGMVLSDKERSYRGLRPAAGLVALLARRDGH